MTVALARNSDPIHAEKAISTPKYATRSKRGTPSGGLAQVWESC